MLGAHGTSGSSRRRPAMWATAIGMLLAWWPSGSPAAECDPVSVALGKTAVSECPQLDADGDGVVSLAEILSGGASGLVARGGGGQVSIDVGSASGAPGSQVEFEVFLDTDGEEVAGTLNDIAFDPLTPVAANLSDDPDCTVQPGINKDVFTAFRPSGCTPGVDCTGIRVIVISLGNLLPIPDGPIYRCKADIDPAASGTYPLVNSNFQASTPDGFALPAIGSDGAIVADPVPLDHFKCYKASDLKDPRFGSTTVSLSDQFVDQDAEVLKPFLLCNPTDKNGEGIHNPVDHLVCYKIKAPRLESKTSVQVENQLGTTKLRVKRPSLLCVPSLKHVLP